MCSQNTTANEVSPFGGDVQVMHQKDGTAVVEDRETGMKAVVDVADGIVTLTDPDGDSGIYSIFSEPREYPTVQSRVGLQEIGCDIIFRAVDLIHSQGWDKATRILKRSGAYGKAVAAFMWSVGTSQFFDSVAEKCY